jgi:hypothetical protein
MEIMKPLLLTVLTVSEVYSPKSKVYCLRLRRYSFIRLSQLKSRDVTMDSIRRIRRSRLS